jgi:hypothetical protein
MSRFWPALLVFLSIPTAAASGQAKMSGMKPSPDGKFALSVVCLGADGHAYADNSQKECGVSVRQKDTATNIFEKRVYVQGGTVVWNVKWGESGNVEVDLLECTSNCFRPELQRGRNLLHLRLVIDETAGKVSEVAGAT